MDEMQVIWHHVRSDRISDAKEVVGIVSTGFRDAQVIVDRLNATDPDRRSWDRSGNYWFETFYVMSVDNLAEFIPQF